MRRSVAQFLEQRLDPSALLVDDVEVALSPEAGEVRSLVRAGLVRSVRYHRGRLLGQVSARELLGAGYVEIGRRWVAAAGPEATGASVPVRRALRGERPVPDELASVGFDNAALTLLAYRAAGALTLEDVALFARLARMSAAPEGSKEPAASGDSGLVFLRELLERPLGIFWPPLSEEPPQPAAASAPGELGAQTFLDSGDLAGCARLLAAEVARAEALEAEAKAGGTAYDRWPQLAELQRLLTGDDAAAQALLARGRR